MMNDATSQNDFKWIATAHDSDKGFSIGDSPEQAQARYIAEFGEPSYDVGFSVIKDRSDYKKELVRVAEVLGYSKEQSIPLAWASYWIIIARITPEGLDALKGHKRASHLVNDWTRDDDQFFISAQERRSPPINHRKAAREKKANIQAIDDVAPSSRQKEWAVKSPWDWMDEMAWANDKGEISLTPAEILYVRLAYGVNVSTCTVNPVYRLRDARTHHMPTAGADLVKRLLDAGLNQSEIAKRCGVSREYLRLLSAGEREVSYAMQVLLEELAASAAR